MTAYTRQLVLVLGTSVVIAVFLYLLIHISEAKLQLLVTVAAVGGGCYAIGLNQDSRFSRLQIERLEAEKRGLEEKVRALKEMYLEDRAAARAPEPPALAQQDSITLRGGSIRDLFGRLMRPQPTVVNQIDPPLPRHGAEPVESGHGAAPLREVS